MLSVNRCPECLQSTLVFENFLLSGREGAIAMRDLTGTTKLQNIRIFRPLTKIH